MTTADAPSSTEKSAGLPMGSRAMPSSGGITQDQWGPIRDAFAMFDRQSRQLQDAYQSLKLDLARSNEALHARNRELTAKIQELRQVSSRLEGVIDSMTDGLLVVGLDGRIERCNSSSEEMLGKGRAEIEGREFAQCVSQEGAPDALAAVLGGGAPVLDRPWLAGDAEGDERSLLVSLAPVSAPDGSVLGAICNLRDVTELRRLERQLHSRERLAALGEMAASVAHEIRNPLGTIEGFARLLRRDLADMPDHLRLAERIVAGAQNLNYVISNLLTYARPMRLTIAEVSVARLFEVCGETLRDRAARAGVELAMEAASPDLRVRGDERQLAQVLLNLGINAIEACASGEGRVSVDARGGRQAVLLRIRDEGCGMDAEQVEKVFDPFFTTKEGGTGLGLSLTKKIVDAHGGDISIESEAAKGSVFTVTLPRGRKEHDC
jgi:PAS domain S-box-containing protein